MPNEIKSKFGTPTALTITLASLANAAGRASTLVDNTTAKAGKVLIEVMVKSNGTPTAGRTYDVYLIRSDNDGTAHVSDGFAGSDAAFTPVNAKPIGSIRCAGSASEVSYGEFIVRDPGPKFAVAVYNNSGQALTATGGDHRVRYMNITDEVQ